jgi:hypothetical protein
MEEMQSDAIIRLKRTARVAFQALRHRRIGEEAVEPLDAEQPNLVGIGAITVCENRLHGEIIFLRNRIVLVIVTAGATKCQAEESRARRVGRVGQPFVLELIRDHGRLSQGGANAIQAGRQDCIAIRRPQFIPGYLFLNEAIKRLIGIERAYDVVPVSPGVWVEMVCLEPSRIGVANHIQPMTAPALAVLRQSEQPINNFRKCVRRAIRYKGLHLFRRRRQPDQVKCNPPEKGTFVGGACRLETLFALLGLNKTINGVSGPASRIAWKIDFSDRPESCELLSAGGDRCPLCAV